MNTDLPLRSEIRPQTGEEFLKRLYGLLQSVRIHEANNRLVIDMANHLLSSTATLLEEAPHVTLQCLDRRIYLQGKRLPVRPENVALLDNLLDFFDHRQLDGLRLLPSVMEAPIQSLPAFARILNRAEGREEPRQWLLEKLRKAGFPWIQLVRRPRKVPEPSARERKRKALKSYGQVFGSIQEIAQKLTANQPTGLSKTRRMIQNMVDLIVEDDPLFRALSTIRFYDDYTFSHSVNVAILSMCMGKRIMLSRKSLESLGLCGLLHDLGKIEVPKSILNKPGKLTDEEFEVMKRHSINSVRLIVKIQASRERKTDILLPPFEHHLKYDLSGYPASTQKPKSQSLFGRILTIADVYDAITSPRVYRPTIMPPDRALGLMWKGAGTDFDPILLKVFINMIGIYPIGTILLLDNDRPAIVVNTPRPSETGDGAGRPMVMLLKPKREGGWEKGKMVNLAEKDAGSGRYRWNIVKSVNAADFGIQPVNFLMGGP